jgi:DNA adenine methylase
VLQVHYVAFLEMLRFQITSRAEFERLTRVDPTTLTDLQRAAGSSTCSARPSAGR